MWKKYIINLKRSKSINNLKQTFPSILSFVCWTKSGRKQKKRQSSCELWLVTEIRKTLFLSLFPFCDVHFLRLVEKCQSIKQINTDYHRIVYRSIHNCHSLHDKWRQSIAIITARLTMAMQSHWLTEEVLFPKTRLQNQFNGLFVFSVRCAAFFFLKIFRVPFVSIWPLVTTNKTTKRAPSSSRLLLLLFDKDVRSTFDIQHNHNHHQH